MIYQTDLLFAQKADKNDSLKEFRSSFIFPKHQKKECLYFTGNSLGLQPKSTAKLFTQELSDWGKYGVDGHFKALNPWVNYHEWFSEPMAKIVGAKPEEVIVMNTLSANLHFLLASFYKPSGKKVKILCEQKPFPSDKFVLESQIKFHGLDPKECLIEVEGRNGSPIIEDEDILQAIINNKDELALIMIGGVNYYTGQKFNMQEISETANKLNINVGFDLAHAAGNVNLQLNDWGVDFAAWCSYKYLNAGPGAVSGVFISEKHHKDSSLPKLTGWWGHNKSTRFKMSQTFDPIPTAESWQTSNAPIFNMVGLRASLEVFEKVKWVELEKKRDGLTGYLFFLLNGLIKKYGSINIITPENKDKRGAQISIFIKKGGKELFDYISRHGVIADWRDPDVIRVAPAPLYNSYEDVWQFCELIDGFLNRRFKDLFG